MLRIFVREIGIAFAIVDYPFGSLSLPFRFSGIPGFNAYSGNMRLKLFESWGVVATAEKEMPILPANGATRKKFDVIGQLLKIGQSYIRHFVVAQAAALRTTDALPFLFTALHL